MNSRDKWQLHYDFSPLKNKETKFFKCRHCGEYYAQNQESEHELSHNLTPPTGLDFILSCDYKEANSEIGRGTKHIPLYIKLIGYWLESDYNSLLLPEGFNLVDLNGNAIKWKEGKFAPRWLGFGT